MPRALLLSPDDQAVNAITGVLEEMTVSCERPLDGVSAAKKLNSHNFDLVLVDCENLPAAKLIFDVCRRGKGSGNPVPIAIVDGRAGLPTAFRLGAELILTKPVSKDLARNTIRTAISRISKDDQAQSVSAADVSSATAVSPVPEEQAAAAAATAASAPLAMSPQVAEIVESAVSQVAESAPAQMVVQLASTGVEELPALMVSTPSATPSPAEPSPVLAQSTEDEPELKPLPDEKLSDDPVLAEIDEAESRKIVPEPPAAASELASILVGEPKPKKSFGLWAVLILLILTSGSYAAWIYLPGFRQLVRPYIERVMTLVGSPIQSSARPQPKAPAPTQKAPQTPVATPSVPQASPAPTNPITAAENSTVANTLPAASAAKSTPNPERTSEPTKPTEPAKPVVSLENAPVMDKDLVILSSKGAEKRLVHRVSPTYAAEAKSAGVEGTVVLKVTVSNTGSVTGVSLVEGNPSLAAPATKAVKQWRYKPYVRDGKDLGFQTIVLLDFPGK